MAKIVIRDKLGRDAQCIEALSVAHALTWVDEFTERGHSPYIMIDDRPASLDDLKSLGDT